MTAFGTRTAVRALADVVVVGLGAEIAAVAAEAAAPYDVAVPGPTEVVRAAVTEDPMTKKILVEVYPLRTAPDGTSPMATTDTAVMALLTTVTVRVSVKDYDNKGEVALADRAMLTWAALYRLLHLKEWDLDDASGAVTWCEHAMTTWRATDADRLVRQFTSEYHVRTWETVTL